MAKPSREVIVAKGGPCGDAKGRDRLPVLLRQDGTKPEAGQRCAVGNQRVTLSGGVEKCPGCSLHEGPQERRYQGE